MLKNICCSRLDGDLLLRQKNNILKASNSLAVTSGYRHFSLLIQRKYSIKVYLTMYFCSNTLQRPPWDTQCSKKSPHFSGCTITSEPKINIYL